MNRHYKVPRVCIAELRYCDGRGELFIMMGVAFNPIERQRYRDKFNETYGWQARQFKAEFSATFACYKIE